MVQPDVRDVASVRRKFVGVNFRFLPADGLSRHRHAGGKFLDKDFQKKVIAIQPGQAQFRHRNHSIRRKGTFGKASVVSA